jgi:hypothetical protein
VSKPTTTVGNTPPTLTFDPPEDGESALNVGTEVKRTATASRTNDMYYYKQFIHGKGGGDTADRWYGPSSAHPGSVQHGFADGHGVSIQEDIDPAVYLHVLTKAGNEVIDSTAL